jgi:hypothetical protein
VHAKQLGNDQGNEEIAGVKNEDLAAEVPMLL